MTKAHCFTATLVSILVNGCAQPNAVRHGDVAAPRRVNVVDAADVVQLAAASGCTTEVRAERIFATHDGVDLQVQGSLQRNTGVGCAVQASSALELPAELMAVDLDGTAYFLRDESAAFAIDSVGNTITEGPFGTSRWQLPFSVSQDGSTVAFAPACGPQGVYRRQAGAWQHDDAASAAWFGVGSPLASVAADGALVFVTGADGQDARTADSALQHVTAEGVAAFAGDHVTFDGAEFAIGRVRPCGPYVCGISAGGVVAFSVDGEIAYRAPQASFDNDRVIDVSGNDDGMYLLLDGSEPRNGKTLMTYFPW